MYGLTNPKPINHIIQVCNYAKRAFTREETKKIDKESFYFRERLNHYLLTVSRLL